MSKNCMGSIPPCQPPGLLALVLLNGGHASALSLWAKELLKLASPIYIFKMLENIL